MVDIVTALVDRVDATLDKADGRFPMYADGRTGEWSWSPDGGWFGGFWPGLLWLAATATGDTRYAGHAAAAAHRLRPRAGAPTLLRGFLFWYGAGLGVHLGHAGGDVAATGVAAARSLAGDVDPVVDLLPPGEEDAREYGWPRPGASVDGLPGTVPLLLFAGRHGGDPALERIARGHADGVARMCLRPDGSVAQTARYDRSGARTGWSTESGSSPQSTWARAQAWGLLGLAQAAHRWPELTGPAAAVADWFLDHLPEDRICYWDFDDPAIPDAPRDTSATAIAAAGLLKLPDERYRQAAGPILEALAGQLGPDGGLRHGCYSRHGTAPDDELIWGDYFLLEAALARGGELDTAAV